MIKISLKNPEIFYQVEEATGQYSYGCNQEWYPLDRQRQAGCGPTTACNILSYIELSRSSKEKQNSISKEEGLLRMIELWDYVTPTEIGIPTTKMFCDKVHDYAKAKNMDIYSYSIDISQEEKNRPDFQEIIEFIETAMINDSPVAFLNLCRGKVANLEGWHWVTIFSIEYDKEKTKVAINIIDEGCIKKIDLKLWHNTTIFGGGFVNLILV